MKRVGKFGKRKAIKKKLLLVFVEENRLKNEDILKETSAESFPRCLAAKDQGPEDVE